MTKSNTSLDTKRKSGRVCEKAKKKRPTSITVRKRQPKMARQVDEVLNSPGIILPANSIPPCMPTALSNELLPNIASGVAHNTEYRIDPAALDFLDPGALIFQAICSEQKRQLESVREDTLHGALKELLTRIVGEPHSERKPRTYLHLDACTNLLHVTSITSVDGKYTATLADGVKAIPVRRVEAVVACGFSGEWEVTDKVRDGAQSVSSLANAYGTNRVRVGFERCVEGGIPGLLWELPAPLAMRLTAVHIPDGEDLAWRVDSRGWIYVPPQPNLELPALNGLEWIELELPIHQGEWNHVGRLWSGIIEAEVHCDDPGEEFLPPPTGSLSVPGDTFAVEQLWDGEPGICGEDDTSWLARAAEVVRHRERAVTAEDYRNLVTRTFATDVINVGPTLVLRRGQLRSAVRVVIVPRKWDTIRELLNRGVLLARQAEQFLAGRAIEGVEVISGPPCLRVDELPRPNDPLWLYREFLAPPGVEEMAVRDGLHWPVYSLRDLREATRE